MKQKFKSIFLVTLLVIMAVIIVMPTKSHGGQFIPGTLFADGSGDVGCLCPWFSISCVCDIQDPQQ